MVSDRLIVHFKSLKCLNERLGYHSHQGGCYLLLEEDGDCFKWVQMFSKINSPVPLLFGGLINAGVAVVHTLHIQFHCFLGT